LEVVVSIDQSTDESESLVKSISDPRLRVFCQDQRLGMTDNYRFLLSQARGEWITILGQDDLLVPFATGYLRKITSQFPDHEVLTSRRSFAFWPNTNQSVGKYTFIYPIDTRNPCLVSSSKFLKQTISGFREYSEGPQLYTGSFVKRSLIERITETNGGNFYRYLIPDVSSAIDLLTNTSQFVYAPLPLFIIGSSISSTGIAIDNLVSRSIESNSIDEISGFFTRSLTNSGLPGEGIYTSFSWYTYEAYMNSVSINLNSRSKTIRGNFAHVALAALKYQSRNDNMFNEIQISRFKILKKELGISSTELQYRLFILQLRSLFRKMKKYLLGSLLLATGRLLLSTEQDPMSHSINKQIERIMENKHLQEYLNRLKILK